MIAYALAVLMIAQSQSQSRGAQPAPQRERFGAWEVLYRVDPITDDTSYTAYIGTAADNFAIACAKDAPDSAIILWRSTTRFREVPYTPQASGEFGFSRWPSSSAIYRFDQDEPVTVHSLGRPETKFNFAQVEYMTARIATASRLVLRDGHNQAHTVTFNLVPADTVRMLHRLNEVCGTTLSATPTTPNVPT